MQNIKKVKERIKALFVWRDVTFTSFAEFMSKNMGRIILNQVFLTSFPEARFLLKKFLK